jgi:hypothetical protein
VTPGISGPRSQNQAPLDWDSGGVADVLKSEHVS